MLIERKLNLVGSELITVLNIEKGVNPSDKVKVEIKYLSGDIRIINTICELIRKMNWNIIKMVEFSNTF